MIAAASLSKSIVAFVVGAGLVAGCSNGRDQLVDSGRDSGRGKLSAVAASPRDRSHGRTCGPIGAGYDSALVHDQIPDTARTWVTWEIPEFQDQQRFVDGPGKPYGPLACVVAAPYLDTISAAAFDRPTGVLAAIVYVAPSAPGIVAKDAYHNLNLTDPTSPFSCVFLRHRGAGPAPAMQSASVTVSAGVVSIGPGSNDGWKGYIVSSHANHCEPIDGKAPLEGSRVTVVGSVGADYPAVARFMIGENWRPAIGVRCLVGWCTIGMPLAMISPPPHHLIGASGPSAMRRVVPGWYDDQQLAIASSMGGPVPLIAKLRATVIPDAGLDGYTMAANFNMRFTKVATVHFGDEPALVDKYRKAWHFSSARESLIELYHNGPGADDWQVKIDGKINTNLTVHRTDHSASGIHIVGTTRWVWSDKDEAIWGRCDEGCCKIEPLDPPPPGGYTLTSPRSGRVNARAAASDDAYPDRGLHGFRPWFE